MTLGSGQPERVLHIHRTAHGDEHVDVELMPLADISGHRHLFIEKMQPCRKPAASRHRTRWWDAARPSAACCCWHSGPPHHVRRCC
jgi:hypothetical protein